MPDRYGENDEQPGYPQSQPRHIDRQRDVELRQTAIRNCELCDDDGYRGATVCDHIDHQAARIRGMAMVRKAMGWTP